MHTIFIDIKNVWVNSIIKKKTLISPLRTMINVLFFFMLTYIPEVISSLVRLGRKSFLTISRGSALSAILPVSVGDDVATK